MKSYTKAVGATVFNWTRFLATRRHTTFSWRNAKMAAQNWPTCACGKQDHRIDRDTVGMPYDGQLIGSGTLFYMSISDKDIRSARLHMGAIESRAAELVAQIDESNNS